MEIAIREDKVSNIGFKVKFDPDTGDQVVTITAETYMDPGRLARILNLQKQRVPLYIMIGSDQAVMDIELVAFQDPADKKESEPVTTK